MELPDYPRGQIAIETVRRASRQLSTDNVCSYREQRYKLEARGLTVSDDTISKFARGVTKPLDLDRLTSALWDFFAVEHHDELLAAYRAVMAETLVQRDPVTNALHQFWLPGTPFDHDRLDQIKGQYAAFVPFFLDKSRIQLMALECGVDDDPGKFRLRMHYRDDDGRDRDDEIEGSIIPCGENIIFVGQIVGQLTPYLFTLSNLPINHGLIERGEGATLVASRAARPSASPILVIRREELPEPQIYDPEQAADAIPEWRAVEKVMSRGYVAWQ